MDDMISEEGAPHFHPGGAPEGGPACDAPGAIGFLVAATIRDMGLRIEHGEPVPGGAAGRLAALRAHLRDHELAHPLSLLIEAACGATARPPTAALDACRQLRDWASSRGELTLAREFAHLLARLAPGDLTKVLEAARIARDAGDHANAEVWFREVIRRSRRIQAWDKYTSAFIGLGVLYLRAGNHSAAQVLLERALRVAYRHRLRSEAGSTHHDLFVLAVLSGRRTDAYPHAEAAARCYGTGHPRFPALVHDVGRCWIETGDYERAVSVLEAVSVMFERSVDDITRCHANLTWAAAGTRNLERFATYERATIHGIHHGARPQIGAEAFLHLGYAHEVLGNRDHAREMAEDARNLSMQSGAVYIRARAEELLERLRSGQQTHQQLSESRIDSPKVARRARALAQELISAVSRCA